MADDKKSTEKIRLILNTIYNNISYFSGVSRNNASFLQVVSLNQKRKNSKINEDYYESYLIKSNGLYLIGNKNDYLQFYSCVHTIGLLNSSKTYLALPIEKTVNDFEDFVDGIEIANDPTKVDTNNKVVFPQNTLALMLTAIALSSSAKTSYIDIDLFERYLLSIYKRENISIFMPAPEVFDNIDNLKIEKVTKRIEFNKNEPEKDSLDLAIEEMINKLTNTVNESTGRNFEPEFSVEEDVEKNTNDSTKQDLFSETNLTLSERTEYLKQTNNLFNGNIVTLSSSNFQDDFDFEMEKLIIFLNKTVKSFNELFSEDKFCMLIEADKKHNIFEEDDFDFFVLASRWKYDLSNIFEVYETLISPVEVFKSLSITVDENANVVFSVEGTDGQSYSGTIKFLLYKEYNELFKSMKNNSDMDTVSENYSKMHFEQKTSQFPLSLKEEKVK